MDERDDLYERIVEEYYATGSVKKVVANLNTNTIKVRRVLITEGLWESETSRNVAEFYAAGLTVKEIAKQLCMSEKNVQSYMPYTRGTYGGTKSGSAERSGEYRDRMKQAASSQAFLQESSDELSFESPVSDRKADNIVEFPKPKDDTAPEKSESRLPGVLKLRFELISPFWMDEPDKGIDMSEAEKKAFLKNAKAKEGIIRDVLVPAEMNLHCMHYMIQKLFGWQNSHLHKYFLSSEDFNMVTDNKRVDEYLNLCGTLFRYPESELDDQFWDDDYEEGISIKSWLKSKYTYGFVDLGVENSFVRNREFARSFDKEYGKTIKKNRMKTLDDLRDIVMFENDPNTLIESLTVRHLFMKCFSESEKLSAEMWRKFQAIFIGHRQDFYDEMEEECPDSYKALLEMMSELIEIRKSIISFERGLHTGHADDIKKQFGKSAEDIIDDLNSDEMELTQILIEELADRNPIPVPFADSIYYNYDFGDDWTVRITCMDAYTSDVDYDWSNPNSFDPVTKKRIVPEEELVFVDSEGKKLSSEESRQISETYLYARPICIYSDGLNVMDDVGGIYGYKDFLETINGDNPHEARESKDWAKWMGWTGRKTKPENVL